ncbi:MAG: translation elongation factor EF-1 subunit alpha [Candidatus Thermoplasmatota archaeon]|nr:translation elongation factor EF-1 subunit alpha [Candidatus Thermoplasmatota archaeon]
MAEKPHMNLVVIGHVDHGKSTLVGRLLVDTGTIPQMMVDKFEKEAQEKGKATFGLAWVMDSLKEERERGVTIDVAHKRFDTNKYYFTVIDAPGHRDFVKNMITGTSQADAAILVCSSYEGVQAQTKEHVFLSRTLGVKQLVIALNKADMVEYSQEKINAVKADIEKLLKNVGFDTSKIAFVPVSAQAGENISKPSDKMPWYKGPTLIQALDNLTLPEKPTNLPLRIPIQDVYTITGVGTVPVGRVECGILRVNDKVIAEPSHKGGEVKDIEMHHEKMQQALPGDNIGFNVRGLGKTDVKRGDVIGLESSPPSVPKTFTAQVVVIQHPSAIAAGYTPVFHAHTAQVACTFEQILRKMDPKTGQVAEENPSFIKAGDVAIIKMRPTRPMVIEKVKEIPMLGRFAIRDMGQTVAAGMCIDMEK